ncbi:flagellar hook-basal body complex protein FliE [Fluviibacterium sp. S390]|uniref:flagellar hook-basal body complex protein FliE n=1 Tax=Fluviibacterium sp. S390 TaxID=3415139 RepID=UPI003C7A8F30
MVPISTFATEGYAKARPATQPDALQGSGEALAAQAIGDFADQMAQAETAAQKTLTGSADAQTLVEALAQTQLAVETAVAVRDKVVAAYQEILRMPI